MPSTATFSLAAPAGTWTLVAAGSLISRIGVQLATVNACEVAVAASTGAIAADGFVVLSGSGDRSLTLDLETADNVYARGIGADGARLRGYRVAR